MAEPQRVRQAKLVELLVGSNLDGLLVTSLPNIRYLTGFSGSNALLFLTPTETWFFTDFRYEAQVSHEVVGASRVVIEQAKGMLAGEYGISLDDAFTRLRNQSRRTNVKLTEICQAVVHMGLRIPEQ